MRRATPSGSATSEIDAAQRAARAARRRARRPHEGHAPNLASLMLLARRADKRVLLTGDGHAADILQGPGAPAKLDDDGRIHVDVLKVQHHGSEHNIDADSSSA